MSGKEENRQADIEEFLDGSKVTMSETYAKDNIIFRDMFNQLIDQASKEFDPRMVTNGDGEKAKIKFKNILIDHCNSVLRAYRQHIQFSPSNKNTQSSRQDNIHLQHKNKPLQLQSALMKELFSKSQYCNKMTPVESLGLQLKIDPPKQFFVMQQKRKVSVADVLPVLEANEHEHKNNIIAQRQAMCNSAHIKIMEKILKQQQNWNRQNGIEMKVIEKPKSKESTNSNVIFEQEGFNDLSFNS